jgi:cytidylate kinase
VVWLNYIQIAIDGPAGAGKSTIAKLIADKLNYTHIDTGSMYRAITLKAIILNIDLADENSYGFVDDTTFKFINNEIYMDGKNVSSEIRGNDVSNNVSLVSSHLYVRERLVKAQYDMAQNFNIVMDGRDIGYNVLPDATYKFFLTASIETRAKRRHMDNLNRGIKSDVERLQKEIKRRDHLDQTRKHSPLKPAEDAEIIDTSDLSIDQVVNLITGKIREEF